MKRFFCIYSSEAFFFISLFCLLRPAAASGVSSPAVRVAAPRCHSSDAFVSERRSSSSRCCNSSSLHQEAIRGRTRAPVQQRSPAAASAAAAAAPVYIKSHSMKEGGAPRAPSLSPFERSCLLTSPEQTIRRGRSSSPFLVSQSPR